MSTPLLCICMILWRPFTPDDKADLSIFTENCSLLTLLSLLDQQKIHFPCIFIVYLYCMRAGTYKLTNAE